MVTYRQIFANREFRAIFAGNALATAGATIQMLALSALVYARTGSPLLAALAYLGGLLPYALGALLLLSYADRLPARGFLAAWDVVRGAVALLIAVGLLPVWGMLLLVLATGAVQSVAVAVRNAVLADVVPDGFILGRATLNVSVGSMQIVGFAAGGALVAALGPMRTMLASAALATMTGLVTWFGLHSRAPRATGRAGIGETWRGNRVLLGTPSIRSVLLGSWLPNGLIVGAEAMYVPYAGAAASVLFIAAALGMLFGDLIVGRWVRSAQRVRLTNWLHLLLAVPYLGFVLHPPVWLIAGTLGLQQRLVDEAPERLRAHALGLDSSGRMTMQAVAATVVGSVAQGLGVPVAMTIAAVASLIVTAFLWPALRSPALRRRVDYEIRYARRGHDDTRADSRLPFNDGLRYKR
jgi:hypothetical protein